MLLLLITPDVCCRPLISADTLRYADYISPYLIDAAARLIVICLALFFQMLSSRHALPPYMLRARFAR